MAAQILEELGGFAFCGGERATYSPLTGERLVDVTPSNVAEVAEAVALSQQAGALWRLQDASLRAALIADFRAALTRGRPALAQLIVLETGQRLDEALAEVDRMIAVAAMILDAPMALAPPYGPVGVVTDFNVSLAVWTHHACLALAGGKGVIWLPSEKTPLVALACQAILAGAMGAVAPAHLSQVLIVGEEGRAALRAHSDVSLPAIPSLALPCGVVAPSADLAQVVQEVTRSAVSMAGQGRAALRHLLVHVDVYAPLTDLLVAAYADMSIGNPLQTDALVGPLIDREAFEAMAAALDLARAKGATVHGGARQMIVSEAAYYVRPALVEGPPVQQLAAPILYVEPFEDAAQLRQRAHAAPVCLFTQDPADFDPALAINRCPVDGPDVAL